MHWFMVNQNSTWTFTNLRRHRFKGYSNSLPLPGWIVQLYAPVELRLSRRIPKGRSDEKW
jgi:hypothetical protein